jgi:2'-5' RNA ligase
MTTPNWFIALPVADAGWLRPLLDGAPDGLRRFHPADLHLTVAFLGGCGADAAEAAWEVAAGLPLPRFEVTLGGVEPMGRPKRPSAYSLVLAEGREAVAAYMGAHRGALLAAAGARPDTRPPLPHITVGRPPFKADAEARRALQAWADGAPPVGARLRLDRLALYTWSDDRKARQFRIVSERP